MTGMAAIHHGCTAPLSEQQQITGLMIKTAQAVLCQYSEFQTYLACHWGQHIIQCIAATFEIQGHINISLKSSTTQLIPYKWLGSPWLCCTSCPLLPGWWRTGWGWWKNPFLFQSWRIIAHATNHRVVPHLQWDGIRKLHTTEVEGSSQPLQADEDYMHSKNESMKFTRKSV